MIRKFTKRSFSAFATCAIANSTAPAIEHFLK
jgi:hypothetical protein